MPCMRGAQIMHVDLKLTPALQHHTASVSDAAMRCYCLAAAATAISVMAPAAATAAAIAVVAGTRQTID